MAFNRQKFALFYNHLQAIVQGTHLDNKAIAQNFCLEERLTDKREESYYRYLKSLQNINEWKTSHGDYISTEIKLNQVPETFDTLNNPNFLKDIDQMRNDDLIRVENLSNADNFAPESVDLFKELTNYINDPSNTCANDKVEDFLYEWNNSRDNRPVFVGFWDTVKDLFDKPDHDWANKLRNRFGLGHFDPKPFNNENGVIEPIKILVLRYKISEVIGELLDDKKSNFAIPTVLDSDISPYFCPTPKKDWTKGLTLDLSDENLNEFHEILHRKINYNKKYIFCVGEITKSPDKSCEHARMTHLDYIDFKNYNKCN